MKRGADNQLTKDGGSDDEPEVFTSGLQLIMGIQWPGLV